MTDRPGKKLFPNPFYVLLLLASVLFVVTVFAYLAGPTVLRQAAPDPARVKGGAPGLADWLDRRGPLALGVELSVMIGAGLLAMATDRWFPSRPARTRGPTV